jgi:hypothetical protein
MTGTDALIALGCIAALAVILILWLAIADAFASACVDAAGEDDGQESADWGSEIPHNDGCNAA